MPGGNFTDTSSDEYESETEPTASNNESATGSGDESTRPIRTNKKRKLQPRGGDNGSFTGDTERIHLNNRWTPQIVPSLIGVFVRATVTLEQCKRLLKLFPGIKEKRGNLSTALGLLFGVGNAGDNGMWLPSGPKARRLLEACDEDKQAAFSDYNVWVATYGHQHPKWDPQTTCDYYALWLGLYVWQKWQDDKCGDQLGDHGRFQNVAKLMARAQAFFVYGIVNWYKSQQDFNSRKPPLDGAALDLTSFRLIFTSWKATKETMEAEMEDEMMLSDDDDDKKRLSSAGSFGGVEVEMSPEDDASSIREAEEAVEKAVAEKARKAKAVGKLQAAVRRMRGAWVVRSTKRAAGRKRHRKKRVRDPDYDDECAPTPVDRVRAYALYVLRIRLREGFDGLDAATFNSHPLARLKLGVTSWGAESRATKLSSALEVLDILHEFEVEKPPDLDDKKMWHWMLDLECDYLQATEEYINGAFGGRECREMPDADVLDICSAAFKKALALNRRQ